MKKFLVGLGIVLVVAGFIARAEETTTITNRGQVIVIKLLDDVAADVKDLTVFQDHSIYATKPGEAGKIVRYYDFTTQGGAAGVTYLLPKVAIPANAVIRDGYIKVLTAVTPFTETTSNSLGIASAADVYAITTNGLLTTGIKATVPVGTAATAVDLSAEGYLYQTRTGADITAGKYMVVLDYELAP